MYLISILVVGFLVGVVAKFFVPGQKPQGCLITSLLGVCGGWVGQQIFAALGLSRPVGFLGSVLGAMVIIFIYQLVRKES